MNIYIYIYIYDIYIYIYINLCGLFNAKAIFVKEA